MEITRNAIYGVHPVIPCSYRSKTYIKVPSRGVWKVCKGLTTLASSLYYSALSLSLPPFLSVLRPLRLLLLQQLCSHTPLRVGRSFHSKKNAVSFPHHPTLFHAHTHTVACLKKEKAASDISFFCS